MLTVLKNHLIEKYFKYCEIIGYTCLKRSSLYTILNLLKPLQQKSLQGLDYYLVDGESGVVDFIEIVDTYTTTDLKIAFKK